MSLNLGILLALGCAIATQLGFLYKHKGANEAPSVDIRHPFRTARQLYACKAFAVGMAVATGAWVFHVFALKGAGIGTDVEEDSPGTPNPHRGTAGEELHRLTYEDTCR